MDWEIHEHYVTFGVQYTGDLTTGEIHPLGVTKDNYVVIEAPSLEVARNMANAIFGQQYSFIYDTDHFVHDGTMARWYSGQDAMAFRIAWIKPFFGGAAEGGVFR